MKIWAIANFVLPSLNNRCKASNQGEIMLDGQSISPVDGKVTLDGYTFLAADVQHSAFGGQPCECIVQQSPAKKAKKGNASKKQASKSGRQVLMNLTNGKQYNDVAEAAKDINTSASYLAERIKSKKPCKGQKIEWVNLDR